MFSPRVTRIAILTATGALLVIAAWELAFLWPYVGAQQAIGTDHTFYVSIARRWLETGQYYLPHQLTGPYVVQTDVDNLYPPISLLLFVPFVWLPYPLWWIVPGLIVAGAIRRLRPARWTWPLLAFAVAWPSGISSVIYGNSNIWIVAFVAAGLVSGWPAVMALIKPSLGFFALIGIRSRTWWIAAAVLLAISLPLLPLWFDYLAAMRNSSAAWYYSLGNLPALMGPIWAWLGRREGGLQTLGELRQIRRPAWCSAGRRPGTQP